MIADYVQGDSLAVGIRPYVHVRHFDAQVGRSTEVGVRRLLARRVSGRIVLLSLGTNDFYRPSRWFAGEIRRVKRAVDNGCVVWAVTPNSKRLNRVLWRAAGPRFRVIHHVAPGPDGIHPTLSGYKTLAFRYRRAARRC